MLTALELVCFAVVSVGLGLFGYVFGGPTAGLATSLVASGAAGVYLVNAYAMPVQEADSDD